MTSSNSRRKLTGDPRPRLDSLNLADIRTRYVGSRLPAETAADMEAMWLEIDRLRFALAAADERTNQARVERQKLEDRMYQLLARQPGAGMAV